MPNRRRQLLLLIPLLLLIRRRQKMKNRCCWVCKWTVRRRCLGCHTPWLKSSLLKMEATFGQCS